MPVTDSAHTRWTHLNNLRTGFITRCEGFASLTLRKLCLPDGYDQYSSTLQHDWQSVGAQAVNHLSNKLMLALFAPSRPFFRLDPNAKLRKDMADAEVSEAQLAEVLSSGEVQAVKELDQSSSRPKLYEVLKHLIVTGNVLMYLGKDGMRVIGIKHYCVKRGVDGRVLEILLRECVKFDELEDGVQEYLQAQGKACADPDTKVNLYKWIKRNSDGSYSLTTWVDEIELKGADFIGKWPEEKMPYRALTWDLSDDSDYGTGLVEDYAGDYQALSALSEAQVQAAILASEFRWLVNPSGMTKAEDFTASQNGAAIPGNKDDISLIQSGKANDLQVIMAVGQDYIQRIGRGFLLGSAVTRDAERVTAVEMRMTAQELETSLGGAYSRLAVDMQKPITYWLLDRIKLKLGGSNLEPVIVTGLDALSRSGDLENLAMFLNDLAGLAQLPPAVQARLNIEIIISRFAAGRSVSTIGLLKPEAQVQQEQQQAQDQALQMQAQQAGIEVGAAQQLQGTK